MKKNILIVLVVSLLVQSCGGRERRQAPDQWAPARIGCSLGSQQCYSKFQSDLRTVGHLDVSLYDKNIGEAFYYLALGYMTGRLGAPRDLTMSHACLTVAAIYDANITFGGKSLNARCALGQQYLTGEGAPKNIDDAVFWFDASQDSEAKYILGLLYFQGKATGAVDFRNGYFNMLLASKKGHKKAQEVIEKFNKDILDSHTAPFAIEMKRIMQQVDMEESAQSNLSSDKKYNIKQQQDNILSKIIGLLSNGVHIPLSDLQDKSVPVILRLAEEGHEESQFIAGRLYKYGHPVVPKNSAKAHRMFLMAIKNKNHPEKLSSFELADDYIKGIGVPKNPRAAAAWYYGQAISGDYSIPVLQLYKLCVQESLHQEFFPYNTVSYFFSHYADQNLLRTDWEMLNKVLNICPECLDYNSREVIQNALSRKK